MNSGVLVASLVEVAEAPKGMNSDVLVAALVGVAVGVCVGVGVRAGRGLGVLDGAGWGGGSHGGCPGRPHVGGSVGQGMDAPVAGSMQPWAVARPGGGTRTETAAKPTVVATRRKMRRLCETPHSRDPVACDFTWSSSIDCVSVLRIPQDVGQCFACAQRSDTLHAARPPAPKVSWCWFVGAGGVVPDVKAGNESPDKVRGLRPGGEAG